MFFNSQGNLLNQLWRIRVQLAALLVYKQRDRNAPGTLARNTPVRAIVEHAFDTRLAPIWVPANAFNRGLSLG